MSRFMMPAFRTHGLVISPIRSFSSSVSSWRTFRAISRDSLEELQLFALFIPHGDRLFEEVRKKFEFFFGVACNQRVLYFSARCKEWGNLFGRLRHDHNEGATSVPGVWPALNQSTPLKTIKHGSGRTRAQPRIGGKFRRSGHLLVKEDAKAF